MKKFFTRIPLQATRENLKKLIYNAVGNELLQMDIPSSFPIIPTINGYAADGEEIEVYALIDQNKKEENDNFCLLQSELTALCERRNIKCSGLKAIPIGSKQHVSVQVDIFLELIKYVGDNDELFADITFGTKPQSSMINLAIQYAYRIKENVSIGCIVYGEIVWERKDNKSIPVASNIYDMSTIIRLDEIVHILAEQRTGDAEEILKKLLA